MASHYHAFCVWVFKAEFFKPQPQFKAKAFPGVKALDNIPLHLFAGKITALIGENGAGKSTLVKILTGIYQPGLGNIQLVGSTINLQTAATVQQVEITAIHQETVLFDNLSVAENIFLGHSPKTKYGLIDVNTHAQPTPSARFMGGREFEMTVKSNSCEPCDIKHVLRQNIMLMPSVVADTGPFPNSQTHWLVNGSEPSETLSSGVIYAAKSYYLTGMTVVCLAMVGSDNRVIVEGPFTIDSLYLQMLATATDRNIEISQSSQTGTTLGAALLVDGFSI